MKRRILAILLTVLMIASIVPATVFAEDCKHTNGGEYLTTVKPVCGSVAGYDLYLCACGEIFATNFVAAPAGECDFAETSAMVKPTCQATGKEKFETCKKCGSTRGGQEIAKVDHNYKELELPGCGGVKVKVMACEFCHKLQNEADKALLEHTYATKPVLVTAPTCQTTGTATYECTKCKEKKTVVVDKLTDHVPTETVIKAPTCTEAGVKTVECKVCGIAATTVVIPAKDHNFDGQKAVYEIEATCTTWGFKFYICNECGDLKSDASTAVAPKGHKAKDVIAPASCVADGLAKCENCNETVVLPKTGHAIGTKTVAANCKTYGYTYTYCTNDNCGAPAIKDVTVSGTTATFEGVGYNVIDKATIKVDGKDVEKNVTIVTFVVDKSSGYDAANHGDVQPIELEKGSCTVDTKVFYYCTCGQYSETKVTPAAGHAWGEKNKATDKYALTESVIPATCVDKGQDVYVCKNCGENKKVETAINPNAHAEGASEVTNVLAATCTEPAKIVYHCKACKNAYLKNVGNANGHTKPAGWAIVDEVGCPTDKKEDQKAGYEPEYTCTVCGVKVAKKDIPVAHEIVKGAAQEWKECKQDGWAEYEYCTECDYTTKVVKPMHDWNKIKEYVAPTCTEAGHEKEYKCKKCGIYEDDKKGETIPATGHVNPALVDTGSADCTQFAWTHYACVTKDCGYEWIVYAKANGHQLTTNAPTAPTCEKEGFTLVECDNCDYNYKKDIKPATGHKNAAGKVLVNKCNDTVTDDRVCVNDNCDYAENKVPTDHKWETTTKEPTCTEYGYTVTACTVCKAVDPNSEAVSKEPAHIWKDSVKIGDKTYSDKITYRGAEWIVVTAQAADKVGEIVRECGSCGHKETKTIGSKIKYTLSVENAVTGAKAYTDTSLVKVKVALTAKEAAAWAVNFKISYNTKAFKFVGYECLNKDFSTATANANDGVVTAGALNIVSGKAQNVTIAGEKVFFELTFKIITADVAEVNSSSFAIVEQQIINNESDVIAVEGADASVAMSGCVKFMDTNNDGSVDLIDLLTAYELAYTTGYNVAADVDQDGEITTDDFFAMYDYVYGAVKYNELIDPENKDGRNPPPKTETEKV